MIGRSCLANALTSAEPPLLGGDLGAFDLELVACRDRIGEACRVGRHRRGTLAGRLAPRTSLTAASSARLVSVEMVLPASLLLQAATLSASASAGQSHETHYRFPSVSAADCLNALKHLNTLGSVPGSQSQEVRDARSVLGVAARANVQAPHRRPAMRRLGFDPVDDRFDRAGADAVVEVGAHHHGDLVRRGMDGEDVADADDLRAGARRRASPSTSAGSADSPISRPLDSTREQQRGHAEDEADHHRGGAIEERIAGQLRRARGRPPRQGCPAIAAPFSSRTMKAGGSFDRRTASNQPSPPLAARNSRNAAKVDPPSSRKATSSTP